jgi:hypothetical protein
MSGERNPSERNASDVSEGSNALLANPIYNWLSAVGVVLAVGGLTAALFFFLVGLVTTGGAGYSGLAFIPPIGVAMLGGLLFAIGYLRERRRQRRGLHSSFHRRFMIDPSRLVRGVSPLVIGFGIVVGTFVVLSGGAGSLMLVEYTESNAFCGEVCHAVMTPEATVYETSAHSQIPCVECHIGSRRDSYINAKMNGLRQVYKVVTGDIERPIPTPIHNRIDSREMCEACHATDRLNEYKALSRSFFLSGEENERVRLRMMLKVGSGENGLMHGAGIHYHMLIANKVEYIARDSQRQDIPWVRVTDADGSSRVFENSSDPLEDDERATLPVRAMECVDCHSRPAHRFPSPVDSVNVALAAGRIDPKIPYIKAAAVLALDGDYADTAEALAQLPERLRAYYEEEYPDELEEYSDALDETVLVLGKIYTRTIFPEMKADWSAHPNNIGHRDSLGCFRCHSDEMVDADGEEIFQDCSGCHAILAQESDTVEVAEDFEAGTAFIHPEDWEPMEEFTLCSDCHTGGGDVYE